MIAFKRIFTQDRNLQTIQDNVQSAISALNVTPYVGGVLLAGVTLVSSGAVAVPHKLGRVPQIWTLADQDVNAVVWRTKSSDSKYLYLQASAACTVALWVA